MASGIQDELGKKQFVQAIQLTASDPGFLLGKLWSDASQAPRAAHANRLAAIRCELLRIRWERSRSKEGKAEW